MHPTQAKANFHHQGSRFLLIRKKRKKKTVPHAIFFFFFFFKRVLFCLNNKSGQLKKKNNLAFAAWTSPSPSFIEQSLRKFPFAKSDSQMVTRQPRWFFLNRARMVFLSMSDHPRAPSVSQLRFQPAPKREKKTSDSRIRVRQRNLSLSLRRMLFTFLLERHSINHTSAPFSRPVKPSFLLRHQRIDTESTRQPSLGKLRSKKIYHSSTDTVPSPDRGTARRAVGQDGHLTCNVTGTPVASQHLIAFFLSDTLRESLANKTPALHT